MLPGTTRHRSPADFEDLTEATEEGSSHAQSIVIHAQPLNNVIYKERNLSYTHPTLLTRKLLYRIKQAGVFSL
jgi:hypothetical protein